MIRVYLAGPDVFLAKPQERAAELKSMLEAKGLEGVFPFDVEADFDQAPKDVARDIYLNNVKLIKSCDFILANMTPFRGPSADVGTAWEMGMATALGKPVFAYSSEAKTTYKLRVVDIDMTIENFDLTDNLMLASSVMGVYNTDQEAVDAMANFIQKD